MDDMEEIELSTLGKPNKILEFLPDERIEQIMSEVVDTNIVYTEDNAPAVKRPAAAASQKNKYEQLNNKL
jgi:hypothetical protein